MRCINNNLYEEHETGKPNALFHGNKLWRKILSFFCVLSLLFMTTGCASNYATTDANDLGQEHHQIILDIDTAADDAMALILLAGAPNITIEGVTTLAGNVSIEQAVKNAIMACEVAERNDISVYPGSTTNFTGEEIQPYSVFGEDGMGDNNLIHPSGTSREEDAVDFIIETVAENPGEIEIISTGPLTNIAKAIAKDPQTMSKVKRIWSMGTGGIKMLGNVSPVSEFNVYLDVPAYTTVVNSGIPMTIIGLDVCCTDGVVMTEERLNILRNMGERGAFIADSLEVLLDFYKNNGCDFCEVCDPVAAMALIDSSFIKDSVNCYAEVIGEENGAYGEVIFFKEGFTYDIADHDVFSTNVVTEIDDAGYMDRVLQLLN